MIFMHQALAKILRGHVRDLADVGSMIHGGYVDKAQLIQLFGEIEPSMVRYPSIDPVLFRQKVETFIGQI